ncbi:MAG: hypothetical protein AAF492_18875 [Verrucomicrobiota bacterium]
MAFFTDETPMTVLPITLFFFRGKPAFSLLQYPSGGLSFHLHPEVLTPRNQIRRTVNRSLKADMQRTLGRGIDIKPFIHPGQCLSMLPFGTGQVLFPDLSVSLRPRPRFQRFFDGLDLRVSKLSFRPWQTSEIDLPKFFRPDEIPGQ